MNTGNLPEEKLNAVSDSVSDGNVTTEPFRVFNTKDEWQHEINRIISQRLKGYNELKDKLAKQEEIIERLAGELENTTAGADFSEQWQTGIKKISEDYPEIDLDVLAGDEHFVYLITNGTPIIDAFKAVVCDELIENARNAERQSLLANIKARSQRPVEIGLSPRNGVSVTQNPKHLSDKQIKEIGERVMRGERIVL